MHDDPEIIGGSRDISHVDNNWADDPRSTPSVLERGLKRIRFWHLVLLVAVSFFAQPGAPPKPAPALSPRTVQLLNRVAAEVPQPQDQQEQPPEVDPVPLNQNAATE